MITPDDGTDYEGFDAQAAAKEIGASIFDKPSSQVEASDDITAGLDTGADPETPPVVDTPPAADLSAGLPEPGTVTPGENSVGKPLPKSWKKELSPEWEKLSPAVREYVHEREAQVMRGINQYQNGYQAWDNLVKPFAPLLSQNPDVNPIQVFQGLMTTHLQLLNPAASNEQKAAIVTGLLQEYGINLSGQPEDAGQKALLDRLQRTEAALAELRNNHQTQQRREYEASLKTLESEVEAFAADPKHEFFNEVANDIYRFIQTGAAKGLADAYDLAVWANPAVRAKHLAKQQAAPTPGGKQPARAPNGQFVNLDENAEPPVKRPKVGSIDDTINAVVHKAYSRH